MVLNRPFALYDSKKGMQVFLKSKGIFGIFGKSARLTYLGFCLMQALYGLPAICRIRVFGLYIGKLNNQRCQVILIGFITNNSLIGLSCPGDKPRPSA